MSYYRDLLGKTKRHILPYVSTTLLSLLHLFMTFLHSIIVQDGANMVNHNSGPQRYKDTTYGL